MPEETAVPPAAKRRKGKALLYFKPHLKRQAGKLGLGLLCLLLLSATSALGPQVLRRTMDALHTSFTRDFLIRQALSYLALVAISGVFRYFMRMILIGVSRDIEFELRNELLQKLLRLPPEYYKKNRIGDLMSRASSDVSAVRMVMGPAIMYAANTLATTVFTLAFMIAISWKLVLLTLLPLALVPVLVRTVGKGIHQRFEDVQAQLANLSTIAQENLSGVRIVRAYGEEKGEERRFAAANQEFFERNRGLIRLYAGLFPGVQAIGSFGIALLLLFGGRFVAQREITLGDFVAFSTYLGMLLWPTIALGWVINLFERGDAAMGRILEVLESPGERSQGSITDIAGRGAIELRNLTFSYGGDRDALRSLSVVIQPGTTVAIVGASGSGKSTLLSLLPRLAEPPRGALFIDGVDVLDYDIAALRRAVAFVPQEAFLFNTSLKDNVSFGMDEESTATKPGRVTASLEIAALEKDLSLMPDGAETVVGERGQRLSGGQRQRASIARAVAVDAPILLLDDAFSAVDVETEERVVMALMKNRAARTTVFASHRIATVRRADRILVLDHGRLVEDGTHDDLVAKGGVYSRLAALARLEEELQAA